MRIVAMLSVHNEADVIGTVVENLLRQEIEVVALDNGSVDGSYEICATHAAAGQIALERWNPDDLDLQRLTRRLYGLATQRPVDWLLWSDGDELLQAIDPARTLRDVIAEADGAGANLIQFDRFDFFMTDLDDPHEARVEDRLRHYSWQGDFNYRAWRYVPNLRARPSLAHYPIFPPGVPYRVHDEKQALRHYPYRDPSQARAKIANFIDKFPDDPARLVSWQKRYVRLWDDGGYADPAPAGRLSRHEEGNPWSREPLYTPFVDRQLTRSELFTADGELLLPRPRTAPLDAVEPTQ